MEINNLIQREEEINKKKEEEIREHNRANDEATKEKLYKEVKEINDLRLKTVKKEQEDLTFKMNEEIKKAQEQVEQDIRNKYSSNKGLIVEDDIHKSLKGMLGSMFSEE